jgi:hypothetical protein
VWRDADITELLNLRTKFILAGDLNAKHPVWNSKVSNSSGLKLLDLFVNCNFVILAPQHPTHFVPNGKGDVLYVVVHKGVRLSEVRVLDIMDSDHLLIMFYILNHIKAGVILDPVEKFTDWQRLQSLASALVFPRVEINSCIEADTAARDFAASRASAYRLSTKTTISDRNRGSSSLERLLKDKQRLRKLWQETRDPACNAVVNWVTKTIRRIARKGALERWETKIENCEVTPQAILPIAKSHTKRGGPKATTALRGPLGPVLYPNEIPM